jgi:hypothetical protein
MHYCDVTLLTGRMNKPLCRLGQSVSHWPERAFTIGQSAFFLSFTSKLLPKSRTAGNFDCSLFSIFRLPPRSVTTADLTNTLAKTRLPSETSNNILHHIMRGRTLSAILVLITWSLINCLASAMSYQSPHGNCTRDHCSHSRQERAMDPVTGVPERSAWPNGKVSEK